jgi:hypothetical protein
MGCQHNPSPSTIYAKKSEGHEHFVEFLELANAPEAAKELTGAEARKP